MARQHSLRLRDTHVGVPSFIHKRLHKCASTAFLCTRCMLTFVLYTQQKPATELFLAKNKMYRTPVKHKKVDSNAK